MKDCKEMFEPQPEKKKKENKGSRKRYVGYRKKKLQSLLCIVRRSACVISLHGVVV